MHWPPGGRRPATRGRLTRVTWGTRDGSIELRWDEALPAIRPKRSSRRTGSWRRDAVRRARRVDLLALPVLGRIVAAHGGRLDRSRDPAFGVRLRWPQYQPANDDVEA